jgi:D-arabinose 1-dehydrogenase-like Zn-dependent alcohol dehydrogenase
MQSSKRPSSRPSSSRSASSAYVPASPLPACPRAVSSLMRFSSLLGRGQTCVGNRQDTIEALKIASTGRVKTTIEVARLEALSEVYERIESSTLVGKVVLDMQ